jgi:hypothetical protein
MTTYVPVGASFGSAGGLGTSIVGELGTSADVDHHVPQRVRRVVLAVGVGVLGVTLAGMRQVRQGPDQVLDTVRNTCSIGQVSQPSAR